MLLKYIYSTNYLQYVQASPIVAKLPCLLSEHRQDRLADQNPVVVSNPVRQGKSEKKETHTIREIMIYNKIY